jgi:hypothetical protein
VIQLNSAQIKLTSIILAVIGMVTVMFAGVILIALLRPDATATVISFVGSTLTTTVASVGIMYNLRKTSAKVEQIERQTNGINSSLLESVTGQSRETIERHKDNGA